MSSVPQMAPVPRASAEQLVEISELLRIRLELVQGFTREEAHSILNGNGWLMEQTASSLVETVRWYHQNTIVRRVTDIRRFRTFKATGCAVHDFTSIIGKMPVEGPGEADLVYFRIKRFLSDVRLAKEYEVRNLVSDPQAWFQDIVCDPGFAESHKSCTSWEHEGKYYSASYQVDQEGAVVVLWSEVDLNQDLQVWHCGRRKTAPVADR